MILPLKEHLPGGIFDHNQTKMVGGSVPGIWWVEAGHAAECHAVQRLATGPARSKESSDPNVSGV